VDEAFRQAGLQLFDAQSRLQAAWRRRMDLRRLAQEAYLIHQHRLEEEQNSWMIEALQQVSNADRRH